MPAPPAPSRRRGVTHASMVKPGLTARQYLLRSRLPLYLGMAPVSCRRSCRRQRSRSISANTSVIRPFLMFPRQLLRMLLLVSVMTAPMLMLMRTPMLA